MLVTLQSSPRRPQRCITLLFCTGRELRCRQERRRLSITLLEQTPSTQQTTPNGMAVACFQGENNRGWSRQASLIISERSVSQIGVHAAKLSLAAVQSLALYVPYLQFPSTG